MRQLTAEKMKPICTEYVQKAREHRNNKENVNVTATDENNVTALNVAQNTRILKRMITQFTTIEGLCYTFK